MVQTTRFSIESSWKLVLSDMGIDPIEILKHARLPEDLLTRKNVTLSAEEYFRLWEGLSATINDPSFPLLLGQSISTETFIPPIFVFLCCPNLNVAMERMCQYKKLIGPMTLVMGKNSEKTTITLDCLNTENPFPDSLVATELVFMVHIARLATREHIVPLYVSSTADLVKTADYESYFGVKPVRGDANIMQFSSEDACRPFLTENPDMLRFFEPELRKRLSDMDAKSTFAGRVRSSLFELLPSGRCTTDHVAKKLAVSKRTLQRLLGSENTSFQKELKQTREKLARHYLSNSALSATEISFLLGFDTPSSFSRAFRSWTGETPQSVRAASAL